MKKKLLIVFVLSSFMSIAQNLENDLNDTEANDVEEIETVNENNGSQMANTNRDGVPFPGLPINENLELLLVFGIAYVFLKIRKNKKVIQ